VVIGGNVLHNVKRRGIVRALEMSEGGNVQGDPGPDPVLAAAHVITSL